MGFAVHNGSKHPGLSLKMMSPSAPALSPELTITRQGFRRRTTTDVDDQAMSLLGWSQIYDQLSAGAFVGHIREVWANDLHIFQEFTSHSLRQSCVVDSSSWWFGIPLLTEGICRLGSQELHQNYVAVRPGRSDFELLTPDHFNFLGLVIPHTQIEEHFRAVNQRDLFPYAVRHGRLKVDSPSFTRLRDLILQILQQVAEFPEVGTNPTSLRSIRIAVMDSLAETFEAHEPASTLAGRQLNRYKIVRDVRNYLLERQDAPVTVVELCNTFKISRRTLQYAFQHVTGMNPNAYLKALRLNGVRRSFRNSQGSISVQQAATDWGFWHLSQFARDYRKLFGELPSESLRRQPAPNL